MTPTTRPARAGRTARCLAACGLLSVALTSCTVSIGSVAVPSGSGVPSATSGGDVRPAETAHPAGTVVGPTGLGPLRLGMTIKQAQATHLLGFTLDAHPSGCTEASNQDDGITIKYSTAYGVSLIGTEQGRTPEGIGAGSTLADVKRVYPQSADPRLGTLDEQYSMFGDVETQVPGNPAAAYEITFDRQGHGQVQYVFLKLKAEQDC